MIKVSEILSFLGEQGIQYIFCGNKDTCVNRFSSLNHYKSGSFTWVKNQSYIPMGFDTNQITLAFAARDVDVPFLNVIRTDDPRRAFFITIEQFYGIDEERPAIGQFTYISSNVKIGKNVKIGHNCSIDGDISIGDNSIIGNNVVITGRVEIGNDCEILHGCIIGFENAAYAEDSDGPKTMLRQYGGVRIGKHVRIDPLVKIARGSIDDTVIGNYAVIGNNSLISHNCEIGENVAMLPGCTLCGSVIIDKNAYISGAQIKNHISIGKNVFVGFGSVVVSDVSSNSEVWGFPARRFPINNK